MGLFYHPPAASRDGMRKSALTRLGGLVSLLSALVLALFLPPVISHAMEDPSPGSTGFVAPAMDAPMNARMNGPMRAPAFTFPNAPDKTYDENGVALYPQYLVGGDGAFIWPAVKPANIVSDGSFYLDMSLGGIWMVEDWNLEFYYKPTLNSEWQDWTDEFDWYSDNLTNPYMQYYWYDDCYFSSQEPLPPGYWQVKATATMLDVWYNTGTVEKTAYYEFVTCEASISSEDALANGQTYLAYKNDAGPRSKVTLSYEPADMLSFLPDRYALALIPAYAFDYYGSQTNVDGISNYYGTGTIGANDIRLWDSDQDGEIIAWDYADPYNPFCGLIKAWNNANPPPESLYLDMTGDARSSKLIFAVINFRAYKRFFGYGLNDAVTGNDIPFQLDELNMVVDGVPDDRDVENPPGNEMNPGVYLLLNTGFEKGIVDENQDPIEDCEVPITDGMRLWIDLDPEMRPLDLKWWKNRDVRLSGGVRFEGTSIAHLDNDNNVVTGNLVVWYYNPEHEAPEYPAWSPVLLKTGDYLPIPEDVPKGIQPFYIERLDGETLSITAVFKPADYPEEFQTLDDSANVTVVKVDLDIDSDNDNGYNDPDQTAAEEAIEARSDLPGKILELNILDRDYNGIPDFADGYNITYGTVPNTVSGAGANKSYDFVPMFLDIPANVDPDNAYVRFTYSASDPALTVQSLLTPFSYIADSAGKLRIWKQNGSASRLKESVAVDGDYVPTGARIPVSKLGSGRHIRLFVEAVDASVTAGDLSIMVGLDPNGNGSYVALDVVKVTVVKVEIVHPIDEDFISDKAGRVMISTNPNEILPTGRTTIWYANKNSATGNTNDGKPAQTEDAKVVISAYVTPKLPDVDVYFEVTDPDDLSPYEGNPEDNNPNDNRDQEKTMDTALLGNYADYQDCLTARSSKTELKKINNIERAVAEVTLNTTGRYSGDNYKVRAVCRYPQGSATTNPPFDSQSGTTGIPNPVSQIRESITLVAWKRIYIEYDQMYRKGGTITADFVADPNSTADDTLTLDNTDDFSDMIPFAGNNVVIFDCDGNSRERTVLSKTQSSITVAHLDIGFPLHSGVKLQSNNDVYDAPMTGLSEAYGENTAGTDGGCFVEFIPPGALPGSGKVPKYTMIPHDGFVPLEDEPTNFAEYWGTAFQTDIESNIFHLFAASRIDTGAVGWSRSDQNYSYVLCGEAEEQDITHANEANKETVVHEFGHRFGLIRWNPMHVDSDVAFVGDGNYKDTDKCIMSYAKTPGNGVVLFCIDCIYKIRDAIEKR